MDSWLDLGRMQAHTVARIYAEAYVDVGRKSIFKPDENGEVITHAWLIYEQPYDSGRGVATAASMTGMLNCKDKTFDRTPIIDYYGADGHILFQESDDGKYRYMDPIQPNSMEARFYDALCH